MSTAHVLCTIILAIVVGFLVRKVRRLEQQLGSVLDDYVVETNELSRRIDNLAGVESDTAPYLASKDFNGFKEGYVFRTVGPQGPGYYAQTGTVPEPKPEPEPEPAAAAPRAAQNPVAVATEETRNTAVWMEQHYGLSPKEAATAAARVGSTAAQEDDDADDEASAPAVQEDDAAGAEPASTPAAETSLPTPVAEDDGAGAEPASTPPAETSFPPPVAEDDGADANAVPEVDDAPPRKTRRRRAQKSSA